MSTESSLVGDELHLPGEDEAVLLVLRHDLGVEAVGGLEVGGLDLLPEELEAVPQHVERAPGLQVLHEGVQEGVFEPRAVLLP